MCCFCAKDDVICKARLAAEKAEVERIEAERKAALAAAAAQSQGAKDRAEAVAAAEAERRRLAEEAERNKKKPRPVGFDLIMKEQSGSHEYDHVSPAACHSACPNDMLGGGLCFCFVYSSGTF